MASITRAFTTRKAKKTPEISPPMPQRALTNVKHLHPAGSIRDKISAPVELISTTNMLSYSAPDLFPLVSRKASNAASQSSKPPSLIDSSSASSMHSLDADVSPTRSVATEASEASTAPTSPGGDSPLNAQSTENATGNHLSCYFEKRTSSLSNAGKSVDGATTPTVPARKLSHTKRTHEVLAHSRSASRLSAESTSTSQSFKNSASSFARDSLQMFSAMPDLVESKAESSSATRSRPRPIISAPFDISSSQSSTARARAGSAASDHKLPAAVDQPKPAAYMGHPFGAELAQVTELAEEFATSAVRVVDEEEAELERAGLHKFAAQDYLAEIERCYIKTYGPRQSGKALESWI